MKIKFLQLNMFMGKYMPTIIEFIKKEKFDIIHLQEVTGPYESFDQRDCYKELQEALDMDSQLVVPLKFQGHDDSYFGNATFYNKSFNAVNTDVVWLHPFKIVEKREGRIIEDDPRAVLDVELQIGERTVHFLNTHLAWSPTADDTDFKVAQGKIMVDYIRELKTPFVLSGDFNVDPNSQIVKSLNEFSRNLSVEHHVPTTLNPRTHAAKHLFPPGITVDYIFVTKDITVHSFRAIDDVDLSDHIGLMSEIEI